MHMTQVECKAAFPGSKLGNFATSCQAAVAATATPKPTGVVPRQDAVLPMLGSLRRQAIIGPLLKCSITEGHI